MPKSSKWIILDRDGVINEESVNYIRSPEEWHALPGSLEAIAHLSQQGYPVVIATNQSGIGRGYYSEAMLTRIHAKLQAGVKAAGGEVRAIYYCPHHPNDGCACRKPKPGMLLQMAAELDLALDEAIFVGDSFRDIQAAKAAGCQMALVRTGYGQKTLLEQPELLNTVPIFDDLAQFAQNFLNLPNK